MQVGASDDQDMVEIILDDLRPRITYQSALEIEQNLRVACKHAARYDRAPAYFWRDVNMEDLNDCPKPHRGFRRSMLVPNVSSWEIKANPPLVALFFDGIGREMDYELGIKLHQMIRRAGRRAKAWGGDTSGNVRMLGNLTNAEDDYRLGLG